MRTTGSGRKIQGGASHIMNSMQKNTSKMFKATSIKVSSIESKQIITLITVFFPRKQKALKTLLG